MNYNVVIEGQTIPVPEEIAANDAQLKAVLAPYYPDVANAMITRTTKDDVTTVNVVKKAGTKGNAFQRLNECTGGQNPIVALWEDLGAGKREMGIEEILTLDTRIEKVLEEGQAQARGIESALKRLAASQAQAALGVVVGF